MTDLLEFKYDPEVEKFSEAVQTAYATYTRIYKTYPRRINIPPSNAGYDTPFLDVHIDSALSKGTFWLGR